jgi:hypothetical protein
MAIRRSAQPKINRAEATRIARQLSAETGQQVTADDVLGKGKGKAGANKAPAPVAPPKVAKATQGPQLENAGWDGDNGMEVRRDLKSVVGGDRNEGTEAPPERADAETKAAMQRQLAMMMMRKV